MPQNHDLDRLVIEYIYIIYIQNDPEWQTT